MKIRTRVFVSLAYGAAYIVAVRVFGLDRASFIAGTVVGVVLYAVSAP